MSALHHMRLDRSDYRIVVYTDDPQAVEARIRRGHSLMPVASPVRSVRTHARRALADNTFHDRAGSLRSMTGTTVMFNSGVIGVHES
jgi:hypothetical protein